MLGMTDLATADTVHVVQAIRETLVTVLPDSLLVHIQNQVARDRDWIRDYVMPLASALVGAAIGGWATYVVQHRQSDREKEEREERKLERKRIYRRRIEMDLWQSLTLLGDGVARGDTMRVPVATTGAMVTMWRGYYRHRDDVLLFEAVADQVAIAEWYEEMKALGESIRHYEAGIERQEQAGPQTVSPGIMGGRIIRGPDYPRRAGYIAQLGAQVTRTKALMEKLGIRNALGQGNDQVVISKL